MNAGRLLHGVNQEKNPLREASKAGGEQHEGHSTLRPEMGMRPSRSSLTSSAGIDCHTRRVDSSTLVLSLSSHRYPYIVFVFRSRFNDS